MKRFIAMLAILASAGTGGTLIALTQPATATRAPVRAAAIVANGSLSCPALRGTVTFKPALTSTGTSQGSVKYNPSGCTTTATNLPSQIIIWGGDLYIGAGWTLWGGSGFTLMTNWWAAQKVTIADSKVTIASSTFTTVNGHEGILVTGTAKGSFAGPVTVTLVSSTTSAQFQKEVDGGGVSALKITSGTASLGNS